VGDEAVAAETSILQKVVDTTFIEARRLLPIVLKNVTFLVELVDWDLDVIGDITGRGDKQKPEGAD
jgi:hypothetical protein